MVPVLNRWARISLLNLLIIATIGIILRYKIVFSLPFVDQKNLLHGHSHFAFSGWVSHTLMSMLVAYVAGKKQGVIEKKYRWLIGANLLTAYGMLLSFPVQGYGGVSIIFSTLSIFVSYAFAIVYWKDLNGLQEQAPSHYWFKAALIFNALSSAGAFSLAAMMATKSTNQHFYLAAVYAFLHFQYNGWFLFGCLGLLIDMLSKKFGISISSGVFWAFALSCIPAYLLSVLWLQLPPWLYMMAVLAALLQLSGWIYFVIILVKQFSVFKTIERLPATILGLAAFAISIKLLLQLASVVPSIGKLAFGFRPIVIGYLHLVLLGIISFFLLSYLLINNYIVAGNQKFNGIKIFIAGVIINELLLMIQGVCDIYYSAFQYANQLLFVAAIIMFAGLAQLNYSQLTWKTE